jgi:fluoroquinolone transport system permease protein
MLLKLTKFDIIAQYRQGFYLVYGIITVIYIFILASVPEEARQVVTAYFIVSDTSILGMVFVGAMVLLEKQQNILQSFFITPLKLSDYLWSKVISLTLIAVLVSSFIGFIPGGMLSNWWLMLIAVLLSSVFFTFLGLGIAARVSTLNGYIAGIVLGGSIAGFPIAGYFFFHDLSLIFPVNAAVELMVVQPDKLGILNGTMCVLSLFIWCFMGYAFAKKQFERKVIQI